MKAILSLAYCFAAYALFLVTILYTIGFVGNVAVSKSIDSGTPGSVGLAVPLNLALLATFGLQHSIMARSWFKRWWTRFVPAHVERSTYVAFASFALLLILWQWRPIPSPVWTVTNAAAVGVLHGLFWTGWAIVFLSSYLIDHFELFGVRQVIDKLRGRVLPAPTFRTPLFYRYVRHPLYLGFLIAFWATPVMTAGHLLFSIGMTSYILVALRYEERDLIRTFGARYRRYIEHVGMLLPRGRAGRQEEAHEESPSSVA
jgi:protein-S-isoprenylcysteine O-methyltransferase Ste14